MCFLHAYTLQGISVHKLLHLNSVMKITKETCAIN